MEDRILGTYAREVGSVRTVAGRWPWSPRPTTVIGTTSAGTALVLNSRFTQWNGRGVSRPNFFWTNAFKRVLDRDISSSVLFGTCN